MKISVFLFAICSCILISSCVTFNQFDSEVKKGKSNDEVFIIKKNGEKLTGSKITQPSSMSQADWFKIDGQKVERKDIAAYQDKKAYHAMTVIAGDIQRLRAGKINLYYFDSYSNATNGGYTSHFLFEKEKGKFVNINYNNFADAVSDNPAAIAKLQEVFPHSTIPNGEKAKLYGLVSVVDIYNQ